jgi:hypothetical protein
MLATLLVPPTANAQISTCKKPKTPTAEDGALILTNPPAAASVSKPLGLPVADQPLYDRDIHGHLPIGFNDGAIQGGLASAPTVARITADMNGVMVRENFVWSKSEQIPGCYQWDTYDGYYHYFVANGVRPIWVLVGTPRWANPIDCARPFLQGACPFPPDEAHIADYAAIAAAIAKRYPLSAAIEVWNEPNLNSYWNRPNPSVYDHLLTVTYNAVKAANPAMRVLGGVLSVSGLDDCSTSTLGSLNPCYGFKPETFLKEMLADPTYGAEILRKMDGLSLHPYPITEPDDQGLGDSFVAMFSRIGKVLEDARAQGVRIVVDELGASLKHGFTEETQCTTLVLHYDQLDKASPDIALSGQVDAVLFDVDVEGGDGYGFVTPSEANSTSSIYRFNPRLVYGEFRAALTGPAAPNPDNCPASDRSPLEYPKPGA